MTAPVKLLYIGVCKENLAKYYPDYIRGDFLTGTFTESDLVDVVVQKHITMLMVDVFHFSFTKSLLNRLKDTIQLINFSYQSIDSLIDLKAAEELQIAVKKLPDDIYCNEVAEFAVSQLLAACKGTVRFDQSVKNGGWNQALNTNISLTGKTLGVVGFGYIGKRIVSLFENWGMSILVARKHPEKERSSTVTFVDFTSLLEKSDFIIFALPITKDTFQMFNASHVPKLNKQSIMVNISRGDVVDEAAVNEALQSGRLYRYCTDVFSQEPVNGNHPFLQGHQTIVSPHVAWATQETLKKTYEIWFSQLRPYEQDLSQ